MSDFLNDVKAGFACKCPKCHTGSLYPSFFNLDVKDTCSNCGLNLSDNDSADGPAVFLIFILGFLLVPLALFIDHIFTIPLWVHTILWLAVALSLTIGALKPLKSYIIFLQYKHRASDWNER